MSYIVETKDLSHQFRQGEKVLDAVALQVPAGAIYGFLGPNGAGKTTTLRLLLGLLRKQTGHISISGQEMTMRRHGLLRHVGALIESPSIYHHLSAAENLEVWRRLYRCPRSRIDAALTLTGLDRTGSKKAGRFSLGMKQRLGIAIALLHEPALLVLDEPTNGLDPAGIVEMRALLQQLNREQGTTILISSHLLTEIEKLVTHIGIINQGKLLYQGTLAALTSERAQAGSLVIDCGHDLRAAAAMERLRLPFRWENGQLVLDKPGRDQMPALFRELTGSGIGIYGVHTHNSDLETIFMNLTQTGVS
ncbi:ATP-binding cassette domain-containing protein [Taibaiella koreensis]|uniref:ATP-binding cassette domain-containing protein n=1 Tax=Taibaiella koreensis TaxID=1268548 RepID=UPI000E59F9CC|nr:ATP-binding cassette domain-containing protein [Taibaiella koreensis]